MKAHGFLEVLTPSVEICGRYERDWGLGHLFANGFNITAFFNLSASRREFMQQFSTTEALILSD